MPWGLELPSLDISQHAYVGGLVSNVTYVRYVVHGATVFKPKSAAKGISASHFGQA